MHPKAQFVRLLAAIVVSGIAGLFVLEYSRFSRLRFEYEHPGGHLIHATEFLASSAWIGFVVPLIALLLGTGALRLSKGSAVLFEVVMAFTWALSFFWICFGILSWQIQNVPVFSHMEWHF